MGRGDITGKLSKSKPKGAVISFNEEARKSFLTGFRKRKNDRRQYARQKIAEQVRQEKLSARQERRTMQKQALASAVSEDEEDGSDAEPEGAEVSTYASASGDALVTTVVEALLPDEDEKEEEDEKQWRVGGPSYTAPKKTKKFNLSQPLSLAVPGYKPKARLPSLTYRARLRTLRTLCTRLTLHTLRRCWRAVAAAKRKRRRRRRRTRSC